MPALEQANDAVKNLNSKHISEVKAYTTPPKEVAKVMAAVMIYLKEAT
jgi:hypothetical protein